MVPYLGKSRIQMSKMSKVTAHTGSYTISSIQRVIKRNGWNYQTNIVKNISECANVHTLRFGVWV